METNDIVSVLMQIPIGTLIAWICVITGIITAIVALTIKLYNLFEKTHKIKEENEEFKNLVEKHESQLQEIKDAVDKILDSLAERDKADLINMRSNIVRSGEEYIIKGSITIRQLRVLEESYSEYHKRNGNSYVTTLMRKVRTLPIIGKLDEEGNDIDD